jgi:3-deoxy-D-manno-octulosonic-acid transferase
LSGLEIEDSEWQALIVDRYGVLVDFYRISNVVVMGGTFNPKVGGHNILEATALGKPVIVGPHTFGIAAQVELLDHVGGLEHARNASELAHKLQELLGDPVRAHAIGLAALESTEANRGAAKRAAQIVLKLVQ